MPELAYSLQAILFVATEPLHFNELAAAVDSTADDVRSSLNELKLKLKGTGLAVVEHEGAYRLVTAPEFAPVVKKFMISETRNDLSRAALETLAIIAYRGPITKLAIEEVRGVSSETMLKNLLQRGLIHAAGTSKEPGKPALYAVSHEFLQQFGLSNLSELPPIDGDDSA